MKLEESVDAYIKKFFDFHRRDAPGGIIGCYMVEYALELLGDRADKLNAVVETRVCLADCVQVMTGCTLGNKYLWLRDEIGKYALTMYDRGTKSGVRVYLDLSRIPRDKYPDLWAFHVRQRDKRVLTDPEFRKEQGKLVVEQFMKLKRDCLSYQRVTVNLPSKEVMLPSRPCIRCGEPFLTEASPEEAVCGPCGGPGSSYYEKA
ncbi:MAG: hypothetical protein HY815_19545 [Candidatus Riflebacteria bacterium]|nr:hypothetical protein [Candidatus Riflebacteria bacterium]